MLPPPPTLVAPHPAAAPPGPGWRRHVLAFALPLVAAGDAFLVAGIFLFFYAARFVWGWLAPAPPPPFGPYLHASLLVALLWTACLVWVGLYDPRRGHSRFDDVVLAATGLAVGGVLGAALSALYRSFSYSRLHYAAAWIGALGVLVAWHLVLRRLQEAGWRRGWGVRQALVVGANELGERVAARLAARPGHRVAGPVPMPHDAEALAELLAMHGVDDLVVAGSEPAGLLRGALFTSGVAVHLAPDALADLPIRLEVAALDGLPVLRLGEVRLRRRRHRVVKRAMDLALAGPGLVLVAPLMAMVATAIRLSSPGPVLYAQERLGRDGHRFTIYKFRSMPVDAEPDGPVWTTRGDERATPLGALLRRYSLDELPQLWNVLVGDMSLVGPRPERPFFAERFAGEVPRYMDRHLVRSGLTGWAQVNGMRGDVDIDARTRYDIQYVENWSVLLDLRILFLTVATIFRRPGY